MSIVRTTFFTFFFTMASRKQVEEMLLLSFIHGFISEEEFGVLHEVLQTKTLDMKHFSFLLHPIKYATL